MRKKVLSILLVLAMVLSTATFAFAADPVQKPYAEMSIGDMTGKTVILHSNDVHGAVAGYAYMAQLKAAFKAAGAEVIVVDAGDYSNGTTYVSSSKGLEAVKLMNAAGYDIATLGNHEFDFGYEQLVSNMKEAEFKVICADILDASGKPIFDANYTYETADGLKIGFFGMNTPETQTKANPKLIQGLTFLSNDTDVKVFKAAEEQVAALKDADLVICLAHLGIDEESKPYLSYDLMSKVSGIDFVIDGHSHTVMTEGTKGEKIQSTGTEFDNIGVVVIDNAGKKIEGNYLIDLPDIAIEKSEDGLSATVKYEGDYDKALADQAGKIIDGVLGEYGAKFATSKVKLNGAKAPNGNRDSETNNGDFITDALLWMALKDAEFTVPAENIVAVTNGGGIRAAVSIGDVTKNDINTVLPFGNTVTVVYVKGSELLEALEASTYSTPEAIGGFPQVAGINFSINTEKDYAPKAETYPGSTYYGPAEIKRVTINSINGKAFDPEATYAVVTNDFCAAGGDTYYAFAAASAQFDTGITMDEAVMRYIKEELGGVIGTKYAKPQGRITVKAFQDVAQDDWFCDAVHWAVQKDVTNGTDDFHFSPKATCTRAQMVTFLWRAAGSPAAKKDYKLPFTDVMADAYYADAVSWAASNGITNGTDETHFSPNVNVTREQLATFIYNYAESKGEGFKGAWMFQLDYADASEISEWANEAMHWCVMNKIVQGSGETLNPKGFGNRAEIVTMLDRYFAE